MMNCRICMTSFEHGFDLFGTEGIKRNAVFVIQKYLWFQPKCDDGNSKFICSKCWNSIDSFNCFYNEIEKKHQLCSKNLLQINSDALENIKDYEYIDQFECAKNDDPYFIIKDGQKLNDLAILKEEKLHNNKIKERNCQNIPSENEVKSQCEEVTNVDIVKILVPENIKMYDSIKKNRKTPEEINALHKKLADEDKVIASFMKVCCNICTLEQKNFSALKKHCNSQHKQKGFVICCDKKYFKRFLLVDHIEKHLNPESYKCNYCEKNFTSRWTLRDHTQFIHKNVENNVFFKCSQCDKTFTNKNLMLRHELFHIPEDERQFKCNSCKKAFPSKATLDCHIRIEHEKRYAGICDICGKSYKNKADLKRHRWEKHEGEDKPKIQCKFCDLQFLSRYTYQLHKNNDHKHQNVEQKCITCEKKFPNTDALKSHIRYTHNAKPKFQCNICDKNFKRQLVLKEHMAVHAGQALYVCPHCPKAFTHSSNMHHHRKRVHPIEFEEARQLQNIRKESWCKKTALKT